MGSGGRSRTAARAHSVCWMTGKAGVGLFKDFRLPGGGVVRVMDKAVHVAAIENAGRKLRELVHRSGKRGPAQ